MAKPEPATWTKVSNSEKAGLQFNVDDVKDYLRSTFSEKNLGAGAAVYLTATLEHLSAELLKLSGDVTKDRGDGKISVRDIMTGIENDAELADLFSRDLRIAHQLSAKNEVDGFIKYTDEGTFDESRSIFEAFSQISKNGMDPLIALQNGIPQAIGAQVNSTVAYKIQKLFLEDCTAGGAGKLIEEGRVSKLAQTMQQKLLIDVVSVGEKATATATVSERDLSFGMDATRHLPLTSLMQLDMMSTEHDDVDADAKILEAADECKAFAFGSAVHLRKIAEHLAKTPGKPMSEEDMHKFSPSLAKKMFTVDNLPPTIYNEEATLKATEIGKRTQQRSITKKSSYDRVLSEKVLFDMRTTLGDLDVMAGYESGVEIPQILKDCRIWDGTQHQRNPLGPLVREIAQDYKTDLTFSPATFTIIEMVFDVISSMFLSLYEELRLSQGHHDDLTDSAKMDKLAALVEDNGNKIKGDENSPINVFFSSLEIIDAGKIVSILRSIVQGTHKFPEVDTKMRSIVRPVDDSIVQMHREKQDLLLVVRSLNEIKRTNPRLGHGELGPAFLEVLFKPLLCRSLVEFNGGIYGEEKTLPENYPSRIMPHSIYSDNFLVFRDYAFSEETYKNVDRSLLNHLFYLFTSEHDGNGLLQNILRDTVTFCEHDKKKRIGTTHVLNAIMGGSGISELFRFAVLHKMRRKGNCNSSILTVLMKVGLQKFYVPLMDMSLTSLPDAVATLMCTYEERITLLKAFEGISNPLQKRSVEAAKISNGRDSDGDNGGGKPSRTDYVILTPAEEVSQTFPMDPERWLEKDIVRRQQFAFATANLPSELLEYPFIELYDVYGAKSQSDVFFASIEREAISNGLIMDDVRLQRIESKLTSVVSELEFQTNWRKLSHGVFEGIDMSQCFIAGGSVLGCLLPSLDNDAAGGFGSSDVDIFVYGVDIAGAQTRLIEVISAVAANRSRIAANKSMEPPKNVIVVSNHCVTLVGFGDFRPIQFILRVYRSPAEILLGFDVDSCCVGLDVNNMQAYASPRAWRALITRANVVDGSRRSPSYESRLEKYARRGFGIYIPGFDKTAVDLQRVACRNNYVCGLRGMVSHLWDFSKQRTIHRKDISGAISDYQNWTKNIRLWFDYSSMNVADVNAFFHEDIENVDALPTAAQVGSGNGRKEIVKLKIGKSNDITTFVKLDEEKGADHHMKTLVRLLPSALGWITANPGRQGPVPSSASASTAANSSEEPPKDLMTGSFHPMAVEQTYDWLKQCEWNRHCTPNADEASIAVLLTGRCEFDYRSLNSRNSGDVHFGLGKSRFNPKRSEFSADTCMAGQALGIQHVLTKYAHPNLTISTAAMKLIQLLLTSALIRLREEIARLLLNVRLNKPIYQGENAAEDEDEYDDEQVGIMQETEWSADGTPKGSAKGKKSIRILEVQTAIRLTITGKLAKRALAEGTLSVSKWSLGKLGSDKRSIFI